MAKTKTATYEIISKEDMAFCKVWQNAESLQEVAEKYPQEDDDEDFSKARRSAGIRAGQMRKIGIYLKRFRPFSHQHQRETSTKMKRWPS